MEETKDSIERIIDFYSNDKVLRYELEGFKSQVLKFFLEWPGFIEGESSVIHSIKARLKHPDHLRDKLARKNQQGRNISLDNFRNEVTDLVGVRVLYLYQDQFPKIHNEIMKQINERNEWKLVEEPKAYTWDPEAVAMYESLNIRHEIKETFYTSVHYVISPCNNNSEPICCEIQVRTLFEEIWGEIDHSINYPHSTGSIACKEQLKVLAKLISSGTRLSDSIFRSYNEYNKIQDGQLNRSGNILETENQ